MVVVVTVKLSFRINFSCCNKLSLRFLSIPVGSEERLNLRFSKMINECFHTNRNSCEPQKT